VRHPCDMRKFLWLAIAAAVAVGCSSSGHTDATPAATAPQVLSDIERACPGASSYYIEYKVEGGATSAHVTMSTADGGTSQQDVAAEPTIPLTEAMRLAADRDGIAREYVTDFHATFELGAPALDAAHRDGLDWSDAIVETFLTLLATYPDTHIVRRADADLAAIVSAQARDALGAGGVRSPSGRAAIERMSIALRGERNRANPGTTADITAAAIFVSLLGGAWQSRNGGTDAASH